MEKLVLDVIILPETGTKFVYLEGVQIDHFGQGKGLKEGKKNFESSFNATIKAHIETHGHLRHLIKFNYKVM